jgi:hypothetical protein
MSEHEKTNAVDLLDEHEWLIVRAAEKILRNLSEERLLVLAHDRVDVTTPRSFLMHLGELRGQASDAAAAIAGVRGALQINTEVYPVPVPEADQPERALTVAPTEEGA